MSQYQDPYKENTYETPSPLEEEMVPPKNAFERYIAQRHEETYTLFMLTGMLNKFLKEIEKAKEKLSSTSEKSSIIFSLKNFKFLLENLKEQDQSHQMDFCSALSELWISIVSYFELAARADRKTTFYQNGVMLVQSVHHYPPNEEHSLGYYLIQHAGKDWIPFPFMKILQKLHEENFKDPLGNHLQIWIDGIDDLLNIFGKSSFSSTS